MDFNISAQLHTISAYSEIDHMCLGEAVGISKYKVMNLVLACVQCAGQ